jgi:hypothetical protein
MVDINDLLEILPPFPKVITTDVIECNQRGNKGNVTAIAITFDDGHTEIRCPGKKADCACTYEEPVRAKTGFRQTLGKILRIAIMIEVSLIALVGLAYSLKQLFS